MKRTVLTFVLLLMPNAIRAADQFLLPWPAIGMGNDQRIMQIKREECEVVSSPADYFNQEWWSGTKPCRWNMAIMTVTPLRLENGVWTPRPTTYRGGRIDVVVNYRFDARGISPTELVESRASLTTTTLAQRSLYKLKEEPSGSQNVIRLVVPNNFPTGYYELAFQHLLQTPYSSPQLLGSTGGVIVRIE